MSKITKYTPPSIDDLIKDEHVAQSAELSAFNALMGQPPPHRWIKEHPYISRKVGNERVPHEYLPIDKVELMLKRIFGDYKVEIIGSDHHFNGVKVHVRLHYFHPVFREWRFHDGIAGAEMQTKAGKSPADMADINPGALAMAFPIAYSEAIKNAAKRIGRIFGGDLNREDLEIIQPNSRIMSREGERVMKLMERCNTMEQLNEVWAKAGIMKESLQDVYEAAAERIEAENERLAEEAAAAEAERAAHEQALREAQEATKGGDQ